MKRTPRPRCVVCNRKRRKHEPNYMGIDVMLRAPLGWYSGTDGETCGQCMERITYGEKWRHDL